MVMLKRRFALVLRGLLQAYRVPFKQLGEPAGFQPTALPSSVFHVWNNYYGASGNVCFVRATVRAGRA
jgi:hypothetical protein